MSDNMPSSFKSRNTVNDNEFTQLPTSFKPIKEREEEEGFLKSSARYASQVPLGLAQVTTPGLITNLINLIGTGEALDPEEIEHIKKISEREGIPFDEEKYKRAVQSASESFPTPSNLARIAEEKTGLPLTPKTYGQSLLQLASSAGGSVPGTLSQKIVGGIVAAGAKPALESIGAPEPLAELGAFATGAGVGTASKPIMAKPGIKTKPSGLPERGYENLKSKREVSESKLSKINEKVENDFRKISEKIIEKSPAGETYKELLNNPAYKQEARELLGEAQKIADNTPGEISKPEMQKAIFDRSVQNKGKGYKASEYDREFLKFIQDEMNGIQKKKMTMGDLVEQYRKNNSELTEYFQPGASKAYNRAKRDALLEHNRSIADLMKKTNPESELVKTFEEGNERWSKIMDSEAIEEYVNEIFKEKIDFKKAHDFFDREGISRPFKRALGEQGYQEFDQLMKDLIKSETPYKMLKVAKDQGWDELFKSAIGYFLHPKLGMAKAGLSGLKYTYNRLINSMLDKPKLVVNLKKGVNDLKNGKFKEAEMQFEKVNNELKINTEENKLKEVSHKNP